MIAVRPPEYFPGQAYMALLARVDTFILADTFQYSRQSFQNRAKLRNPQGWQWISVPLKSRPPGCSIAEAEVENREPWLRKHWRAFEYNYRTTPYFEFYEEAFQPLLDRPWTYLGDLTCTTVELLHQLLELDTRLLRASSLAEQPAALPGVMKAAGDDQLVSLPDAAAVNREMGVDTSVLHVETVTYRQNFEGFEPGMSTVDLLFNYGPETRSMLREGVALDVFSNT